MRPVTPFKAHTSETLKVSGRRILGWQTLLWTALAALVLYGLGLGNHELWDYFEPYVAGIVREMATTGDWIVPTLNGHPYLEKPPLFYALGALVCRATGSFEPWALRLPSALLALATVVWTSFLGWRLSSARAGGWAGFMVGTSVLFFQVGHMAVVDMTLTAAVSFSLGLAFLALVEPYYRARWIPWFWTSLGLAFLAKGLVGPVLILLPLGITILIQQDRELAKAFLRPSWGMAVAVLLALGWVVPLALRGGKEFLVEVFLRNTLGRFMADPSLVPRTGRLGEHVEPFTFYLQRSPGNLLPWLAIWAAAMASAFPRRRRHHLSPRSYFLPLAFALNLLLLSLSAEKRMEYILPVFPITFLHAALWLDMRVPRARRRIDRTLMAVLGLSFFLVGILAVGFPWIAMVRAHLPWPLALGLSAGSLALSIVSLGRLWRRDFRGALDWGMTQWAVFLALFLAIAVPQWDREIWRPLAAPYADALRLERRGARVVESQLTETQLGFASLRLRHDLPVLDTPAGLQAALAAPVPVVALVEPAWWASVTDQIPSGSALPTEASTLRPSYRRRAPVVVLNPAAHLLAGP
ncbi:MAG TPA: glycosyltransferase family 39 protein [Geothrix sp.]|uniref:ArnT family glycosyltransferase n=1 Tax=Geothrix mesophila TaxID=2922723 RepID=UPI001FAB7F9C|nr:glycosyltransferase family 39 protein [Geothrix sp. SG198]HJV39117.1 glycosyltransferase family 39 protein [Geothrix sp.]